MDGERSRPGCCSARPRAERFARRTAKDEAQTKRFGHPTVFAVWREARQTAPEAGALPKVCQRHNPKFFLKTFAGFATLRENSARIAKVKTLHKYLTLQVLASLALTVAV